MPGPLFHVGATAICTHAGSMTTVSTNARVLVNGMPVATIGDTFLVTGCTFTLPGPPPKPQPCVKVQWLMPALRVMVNGQPVILQTSTGLCQSVEQIPQGAPTVLVVQPRVIGT